MSTILSVPSMILLNGKSQPPARSVTISTPVRVESSPLRMEKIMEKSSVSVLIKELLGFVFSDHGDILN